MKKIEFIWREILDTSVGKSGWPDGSQVFEQKVLATKFGFSTSTVHAAVSQLSAIGAVAIKSRGFRVTNFEKILLFWATHRNLDRDIIYQTHVDLPVTEIEGLVDNQTVYAAYSSARHLLNDVPADYDKVYVYGNADLSKRFPKQKGPANFFVLKKDPSLKTKFTNPAQTFVDLWNLSDWFAKDYLEALKDKYYAGVLS